MKTEIYKTEILNHIKLDLANNNVSQSDLAKHMGLSIASVSRKLNGVTPITLSELIQIVSISKTEINIKF